MHLRGLDVLFWAAGFIGHVTLLFVLIVRRRICQFPIFGAFVTAFILRTIILFCIQRYGTKAEYFYSYWAFVLLVDVGLQLGVVAEISSQIFRFRGNIPKDVARPLVYWMLGSLLVAGLLTGLAVPEAVLPVQRWMIRGSFFGSALMSELFMGMIWLSVEYGFPLRMHVASLCQALGIYALCDVLIEGCDTYFGLKRGDALYLHLSHLRIVIYLISIAYLVIKFWQDVPMPVERTDAVKRDMETIGLWVEQNLSTSKLKRMD